MRLKLLVIFLFLATTFAVAPGTATPVRPANPTRPVFPKARPLVSPEPLAYGWPQMLRDPLHSSTTLDPNVQASTASTMGINWMAAIRAADLGSPVAAYNVSFNKTLVYVGGEAGNVTAFDEATGQTVWSTSVGYGDAQRSTPAVAPDGSVWVSTAYGSTLYKLNGNNGAVLCSVKQAINFDASPMFVTPQGGVPTVYIATNDSSKLSGPTLAVNQSNCQIEWQFTQYTTIAGAWATTAYGVDANGRALVFEGTADPDSTEYAIDANTGALDWSFKPVQTNGNYDIGAAATVSPPGDNGFADGVLYVITKYGVITAVDLTTGAPIWAFNFNSAYKVSGGGRSTAALEGNMLVFGMADGVLALNATTGAPIWHYQDPAKTEVISSPAIAGPLNDQVVTFGDTAGLFHILRLVDGVELYHYQTGGYITSSPAVINDHILIDSSDGFLYDFKTGGGNVASPTTSVTSPGQGSSLPNPNGSFTVAGNSSDANGVSAVEVAVQAGGPSGQWYDAATNSWSAGPVNNWVAVANPNTPQSTWSLAFPIPAAGSTYQVFANSVDVFGQVDRTGASPTFAIQPSTTEPTVTASALFVAPGATVSVSANAFSPGETVVYTLLGKQVGSAVAGSNGAVPPIKITVSAKSTFGLTNLTATGQTSGDTTTAPLNISNAWDDLGYGPTRISYEPDDQVFAQTLQATNKGYVSRAWLYMTSAAVNASPAVAAGNAYVGNDAGVMTAVDTISGAPMWTYTNPSGAPIHASPAIDLTTGLLVFGSDDGTLTTLSAATGALIGSATLDGIATAPAIANGSIYLGTDAGSVLALNESSGALVWSQKLAAAVHAPPSVDVAKTTLVTGDDSGTVTALNAKTGALLWTAVTGGAITSPPAIEGGFVYVGSSDGKLYAYVESTGALSFSFNAASPIHSQISLPNNAIIFGTDGGSLYGLTRTGSETFDDPFYKNAIVGVSGAQGVPWVETSAGLIGASKSFQSGRIVYKYQTGAGLSTQPAVVNGAAYIGAQDGGLYAFTPYGFAPASSRIHAAFLAHAKSFPPARWTQAPALRYAANAARSFEPFGRRDFPLHVDRHSSSPAGAIVAHGGPVQTAARAYVIYWAPGGSGAGADGAAAVAALRQTTPLSGAVVDTAAYPRRIDDTAVQAEIMREIARTGWQVDVNAQVFLVAGGAVTASGSGYCAYHSAFHLGASLARPVPYAFVPHTDTLSGCGAPTAVLHRVQVEMKSDPLLNAFHDERGDELTGER